jgi:ribose 5-phosphate isomerase B
MKIYLGADHNGFEFKEKIERFLKDAGHDVVDVTGNTLDPDDDFPKLTSAVVSELLADKDKDARAILLCGSGQGMAMAANRFKGIRASLCWSVETARAARNDEDSNILCLNARYTKYRELETIIMAWLRTPFAGAPRYKRRIRQLDQLNP